MFCCIGHIHILGTGLELACNGCSCEGISLKRVECNLYLKTPPCISLTCKLAPVRYREYENGVLKIYRTVQKIMSKLNDYDLGELRTRQFWREAEHLKMQAKVGQITCNVTDQRRIVSLPPSCTLSTFGSRTPISNSSW